MGFLSKIKLFVMGVGLYKIGEVTYDVGSEIYFRHFQERQPLLQRYGRCYALVTDASQELGSSYAEQLAKNNFNLVLISKDPEQLKQQKQSLESNYGVNVKTIQFDFTTPNRINDISEELKNLDIGILINNLESFQLQKFDHLYRQEITRSINSNILSSTLLLNTFLPKMLERNQRSLILNVGSELGDFPAGYVSLYSATKAFTNTLSRNLQKEFDEKIDVRTALPGPLETKDSLLPKFENEDDSYLTRLSQSVTSVFDLLPFSSVSDSAEETLSLVDNKKEIPGTSKHLAFYNLQKLISVFPWRTGAFANLYEKYGEKRTSNISSEILEEPPKEAKVIVQEVKVEPVVAVVEVKPPQPIIPPAPIIQIVEKIIPAQEIPVDITKTLSNDFLLPFITKDYTSSINEVPKN